MKHDELLIHLMVLKPEETVETRAIKLNIAIRAVLELHKPWENWYEGNNDLTDCKECSDLISDSVSYPCSTIQAIEKELA